MAITFSGQPLFAFSHHVTRDVIFQNAPKQEGNITYASPENLGEYRNTILELNLPIPSFGKKMSGFIGNQAIYNHYEADYLGGHYDRSKWNWRIYGQIAFKPTPTLVLEATGSYSSPFLNEFITLQPTGALKLAIQKTLWDKRARVGLNLSDAFYSAKTVGRMEFQNIHVNITQRRETRNLRFSFIYTFGNQKLKAERARKTASDAETIRVKAG